MPSPPLSPSPRRWRPLSEEPHPDFAALLSSFEVGPSQSEEGARSVHHGRNDPDTTDQPSTTHLAPLGSIATPGRAVITPEIRTISPSPERPEPSHHHSPVGSARSSQRSASPLVPPQRGRLFGDAPEATAGSSGLSREGGAGGIVGPRIPSHSTYSLFIR